LFRPGPFQSASPFVGTLSPPADIGPPDLFNSVLDPKTKAQLGALNWTSTIGNNKVFEARFGYKRFENTITVNNKIDPKSLGFDTGPLDPEDYGVPALYYLSYFGYIGGVGNYPITTTPTQSYDVASSLT